MKTVLTPRQSSESRSDCTDKWACAESIINGLQIHECRAGNYVRGTVATPQGYVLVYSQGLQYLGPTPLAPSTPDTGGYSPLKHTSFSIILQGRRKERVIDEAYSERRLVTLAREFAVQAAREREREGVKENTDA